jgi:hypothetical protein
MRRIVWLPLVLTFAATTAAAEDVRTVDHARMRLGDLVPKKTREQNKKNKDNPKPKD